jgi:hypothetical protein
MSYIKKLKQKIYLKKLDVKCKKIVFKLKEILKTDNNIPILIISYNNGVYVENMVKQLNNLSLKPIIIDNKTTNQESLSILSNLEKEGKSYVIYSDYNLGHQVGF